MACREGRGERGEGDVGLERGQTGKRGERREGRHTYLVLLYGEYVYRQSHLPVVELHAPLGYEQLLRQRRY
jgi:hypothetical protein